MPYTLAQYVFATQRLLHDAQAQTWPVSPDLIYYINLARDRVALDTLATRVLPIITLNASQERYSHSYVNQAILTMTGWSTGNPVPSRAVGTVIGVNFVQSTAYQPPLARLSWTELNAKFRAGGPTTPSAIPQAWAPYSDNQNFFIAPVPGSAITAEIDCVYLPTNLLLGSDLETAIADPLGALVPLMAARWALYYMDEQDTAATFLAHYKLERDEIVADLPAFEGFSV